MKSWREVLPVHPAAEVFPMLTKSALRELADDIAAHGLTSKVATYIDPKSGKEFLLDGRNRLDALELAGMEVVNGDGKIKKQFHGGGPFGGDPVAWVVSANIHRRHLSTKAKREVIAMLLKETPRRSNHATAAIVGASDKTVARVRDELEQNGEVRKIRTRVGADGVKQPARKPKATPPKFEIPDLQQYVFGTLDDFAAHLADKAGRGAVQIKTTVTFADGTTIERTTRA